MSKLTFIVPVTKEDVLERNVLSSKVFRDGIHQFIFQRGYTNVAKAYNDAVLQAENEILVFCHQDVFFPEAWESDFQASLAEMRKLDPDWGVLGIAGAEVCHRFFGLKKGVTYIGDFSSNVNGGEFVIDHLYPTKFPRSVSTLDEFLIITKKENAFFDEDIPNNHFYGVDLCLATARRGLRSYAIAAFAHHDSAFRWVDEGFYRAGRYMAAKYPEMLPIATPCVLMEEHDGKVEFVHDFVGMSVMTLRSLLKFPKRATRKRRPF